MSVNRRSFVGFGMAAMAAPAAALRSSRPAERVSVGVMGLNGRGTGLARGLAGLPNVDLRWLCDVDPRAIDKARKRLGDLQSPRSCADYRRMLDDKNLDAIVVATPDHWHAPATILGCDAGKHVYVEKPLSHNPQEGEWAVAAATRHRRVVQMGNQRRSWPELIDAMAALHDGVIGKIHYARSWYANRRGATGRRSPATPPDGLDWDLWQGPAPRLPFTTNVVHYRWHWYWHWGTGELGNNGVHALDLCRWGMKLGLPTRVTSAGGRLFFDDDQETPDTQNVTFRFEDDRQVSWEGLSCNRHGVAGGFGVSFHGTEGSLQIDGGHSIRFDGNGKEVERIPLKRQDTTHLQNFVDAVRGNAEPNAGAVEAHRSTMLCHLGNIAQRTGGLLRCDPSTGRCREDDAQRLWSRDYADGYTFGG